MQGYALCADYRVFEGLIGPRVHGNMAEWLEKTSKCHRGTRETGTESEEGTEVETDRWREGNKQTTGNRLVHKLYGVTERGDVIGLSWHLHTSVRTSQPGGGGGVCCMCYWERVCQWVPVHNDVHIRKSAHVGYGHFFFFFTAHICQCLYQGTVKGLNSAPVMT